ncbi:hypothetical protein evm_010803 [Chilo suppressalis]|nr:hypothetical protein evm_010803 [Chilo suppressalis]
MHDRILPLFTWLTYYNPTGTTSPIIPSHLNKCDCNYKDFSNTYFNKSTTSYSDRSSTSCCCSNNTQSLQASPPSQQ